MDFDSKPQNKNCQEKSNFIIFRIRVTALSLVGEHLSAMIILDLRVGYFKFLPIYNINFLCHSMLLREM